MSECPPPEHDMLTCQSALGRCFEKRGWISGREEAGASEKNWDWVSWGKSRSGNAVETLWASVWFGLSFCWLLMEWGRQVGLLKDLTGGQWTAVFLLFPVVWFLSLHLMVLILALLIQCLSHGIRFCRTHPSRSLAHVLGIGMGLAFLNLMFQGGWRAVVAFLFLLPPLTNLLLVFQERLFRSPKRTNS